jgi:hypothetical protein
MEQPQLEVGQAAPAATLLNPAGASVLLSDMWAKGPTLLTFLRHFG